MKKTITLKDIYLRYPYKCQQVEGTTVPDPYVKKRDINCDHSFSLSYSEYREIIDTILDTVKESLLEGDQVNLPLKMGYLQILKYKGTGKGFITDEHGNRTRINYKNLWTDGYQPLVKWIRNYKVAYLSTKWFFTLKIMKTFKRQIHRKLNSGPGVIYKYSDA